MNGKKRKKIIALALVATLACSGSAVSVFAATAQQTEEKTTVEQRDASSQVDGNASANDRAVSIDETTFPDANFRQFVSAYDIDLDGKLSSDEIAAVTTMDCSNKQISSLQGIECFTALKTLKCFENQLTELDLSANTALTYLDCRSNGLVKLNVTQNTALTTLDCDYNQLTTLDVSANVALKALYCTNNQLTELNVKNNVNLQSLYCDNNKLTNLDVSANTALTQLYCTKNQLTSLDISNNPRITTYFDVSGQKAFLTQVPRESYDLAAMNPNIDASKISNLSGATLKGTVISDYTKGNNVTYTYDIGNGKTMDVTLDINLVKIYSNITYKDGTDDFTAWQTGYTAPAVYEEETGIALPTAENIAKEGHTFVGWYDNENFTGNPITEITAAETGDKTLYAKFELNQYMVTFKDWDGTVLKTETVAYNTAATSPADPTREGYRFIGWSAAFDNVTGDMEVTAQYEQEAVTPNEQVGGMNNTNGENLQTVQTGDNSMVEPLLATTGVSSLLAAAAFFLNKKRKGKDNA